MSDLKAHIRDASHPRNRKLRALIFGKPGVGKTVLAVQIALELGERCLYIPTEPGDETLEDWPDLLARTSVMDYPGINMLRELASAYREGEFPDHPTLIIDTIDELTEIMLDDLVTGYKPAKDTRPKAEPRPGSGLRRLEVAGTDDYRFLRDGVRPALREICSLPVNLILLAHVREPTWADEAKQKATRTPLPAKRADLPAQTYRLVSKYVGLMGHMTREGGSREVSFKTDSNKEEVKSRIRDLDNRVIDADELPGIIRNWSVRTSG
jgi:hypothetical protein